MLKWIINALLIYAAYKLFTGFKKKGVEGDTSKKRRGKEETRKGDLVEDPHCGVYIPVEQAVKGSEGNYYCSAECAEAHKKGSEG